MSARFVRSASRVDQLPRTDLPEFAFAGRSNVGKSTLLGQLLGNPSLVRTSRTPGRTQLLNYFILNEVWGMIDLPGYGYAKVSKQQRGFLGKLVQQYFEHRTELTAVVQLLDLRRDSPSPEDVAIAEWVRSLSCSWVLVGTKADLIPKNRLSNVVKRLGEQLEIVPTEIVVASHKNTKGRDKLFSRLRELAEQRK